MLDIFPVAAVGRRPFYLCLHQRRDAVHQHLDVKGLLLHHHLPGFQFAHVQHVVDQRQKMVGGEVYFIKAAVHLPGIVPVGAEDVQHTENAVDGVRMSWLIRFMKAVLALLAESASSKASCRR